jgi:hypothetical protein
MKEIKITVNNKSRIEKVLQDVERRSKTRKIETYDYLVSKVSTVSRKIGITKKAMEGTTFIYYEGAEDFPNAYKFSPQGTKIEVRYGKSGAVYLVDISRDDVDHKKNFYVRLSESAKKAVLEKMEKFNY